MADIEPVVGHGRGVFPRLGKPLSAATAALRGEAATLHSEMIALLDLFAAITAKGQPELIPAIERLRAAMTALRDARLSGDLVRVDAAIDAAERAADAFQEQARASVLRNHNPAAADA